MSSFTGQAYSRYSGHIWLVVHGGGQGGAQAVVEVVVVVVVVDPDWHGGGIGVGHAVVVVVLLDVVVVVDPVWLLHGGAHARRTTGQLFAVHGGGHGLQPVTGLAVFLCCLWW